MKLPVKGKHYLEIRLNKYVQTFLSWFRACSVTLTTSTISISFSKETAEAEPGGYIGLDRNLDNVTIATSDGESKACDLSGCTRIKLTYRAVKSRFKRNDARTRGAYLANTAGLRGTGT